MKQMKLTQMRKRAELRAENMKFMQALAKSKERATRQTERHYLNQPLMKHISPQMKDSVLSRRGTLDNLLA